MSATPETGWYHPRNLSWLLAEPRAAVDVSLLPKVSEQVFEIVTADISAHPETLVKVMHKLDQYSHQNPHQTCITASQILTHLDALKRVYSVKIDTSHLTDWDWMPGDAFGFLPENDPEIVDYAVSRLSLSFEDLFSLKVVGPVTRDSLAEFMTSYNKPITIHDLCKKYIDWTYFPKKSCLRHLADFCSDEQERNVLQYLSIKEGSADYLKIAGERTTILDILRTFKSCKPDLQTLLSYLPLLHPRFYSISNSRLESPHEIEFIFSTFDYETPEGLPRKGIATSWLERTIASGPRPSILLVPRPNSTVFRPPQDPQAPFIMVCAGTGISPFIGFLRHFNALNAKTNGWLFFGFRNQDQDFLFKDEINSYLENGTLNRLSIAVSRQPELGHPKYAQDAFSSFQAEIYKLMMEDPRTRIYICGDELTMVKGVNDAITEMICTQQNQTPKAAKQICMQWASEGRIIRDVWI